MSDTGLSTRRRPRNDTIRTLDCHAVRALDKRVYEHVRIRITGVCIIDIRHTLTGARRSHADKRRRTRIQTGTLTVFTAVNHTVAVVKVDTTILVIITRIVTARKVAGINTRTGHAAVTIHVDINLVDVRVVIVVYTRIAVAVIILDISTLILGIIVLRVAPRVITRIRLVTVIISIATVFTRVRIKTAVIARTDRTRIIRAADAKEVAADQRGVAVSERQTTLATGRTGTKEKVIVRSADTGIH